MTFMERVRVILAYKRITQKEFASKVGMSRSQMNKLLLGKRKPLFRDVESIVRELGLPYECLIGESPLFDDMLKTIREVASSPFWC